MEQFKRWESRNSSLLFAYQDSQAPSFTLTIVCSAELSVCPKEYLDSGREAFYSSESPLDLHNSGKTATGRVENSSSPILSEAVLWLQLVVQMTEWCHLWLKALHHQWFPRIVSSSHGAQRWYLAVFTGSASLSSSWHVCISLPLQLTHLQLHQIAKENFKESNGLELRWFANTGYIVTVLSRTHSLNLALWY